MKKVFILTDLEGVAGVVSFREQSSFDGRYYDQAQQLLTEEVNAAVDALLEVGVEDILVCDGHGFGAIWYEKLHPAAKLLHGRPITLQQLLSPLSDYDTAIMIGQHARAGVKTSNQNHTQDYDLIDWMKLNDTLIGEIAQFALYAGAYGIPLIFLSGEQAACDEAEKLVPGITTASVKKGLSRGAAISLSTSESRQCIRAGIRRAAERHLQNPIDALAWSGPYRLDKRFTTTDAADVAAGQHGAERIDDQIVRFDSEHIQDIIYR